MSHGNRRNFQKWTILPRDTMSPAGICVTLWDTENITTGSTVRVPRDATFQEISWNQEISDRMKEL